MHDDGSVTVRLGAFTGPAGRAATYGVRLGVGDGSTFTGVPLAFLSSQR